MNSTGSRVLALVLIGIQIAICTLAFADALAQCGSCSSKLKDANVFIPILGSVSYLCIGLCLLFLPALGGLILLSAFGATAVHTGLALTQIWHSDYCWLCISAWALSIAITCLLAYHYPAPFTVRKLTLACGIALTGSMLGMTLSLKEPIYSYVSRIPSSQLDVGPGRVKIIAILNDPKDGCDAFQRGAAPLLLKEFSELTIDYLNARTIECPSVPTYLFILPGKKVRVCKSQFAYPTLRAWMIEVRMGRSDTHLSS